MKRSIAIFLPILVVVLIAGAGLWFWQFRLDAGSNDQLSPNNARGQISRGYHLTKILSTLRDDQPERVLIAIQNDWELRPTGGFITAFGEGEIINGQLTNFRVVPSEFYDESYTLSPPMPTGLADRITTPTLTMRDANWDVDFATTAGTLSRYYVSATGKTPDLVIAITTQAAEQILKHTGPITFTVNGHDLNVSSENVTDTLERYTDQEFRELGLEWETRKQVLSEFGYALLPRLHELAIRQPFELIRTVNDLGTSYDVQAWSPRPELNSHLRALGAAQLVETFSTSADQTDALLIVDTNVGARKSNRVVDQRADYRVDLSTAQPSATLSLTYTHKGEYSPIISDYHDTIRIYVPYGSSLTASSNLVDVHQYVRHNRAVFEGRMIVSPGQSKTVSFTYSIAGLPPTISIDSYRILLERQPGASAYPVSITVVDGPETAATETDMSRDRILRVEPN